MSIRKFFDVTKVILIIYFGFSAGFSSMAYMIDGGNGGQSKGIPYEALREKYCEPKIRKYIGTTLIDYGTFPGRIVLCILTYRIKR